MVLLKKQLEDGLKYTNYRVQVQAIGLNLENKLEQVILALQKQKEGNAP